MSIDVIGINPVANLIRQCKLTKFIIYREGATKFSTPVFENIISDSNTKTVASFTDWANNILHSNPVNTTVYEIFLFDEKGALDEDESAEPDSEDVTRPKITKKKANKIRFRFQLASNNVMQGMNGGGGGMTKEDIGKMVADALIQADEARRKDEILKRLEALEHDDEDEDDEYFGDDTLGRVENLFDRIEGWALKKPLKKKEKVSEVEEEEEVISGVEDIKKKTGRDIKGNINKAITTLYKYDRDLDLDLLKFAKLAENDTEQFKTFIKALRAM